MQQTEINASEVFIPRLFVKFGFAMLIANAAYEILGALKIQDRKMTDKLLGVENVGLETDALNFMQWKMQDYTLILSMHTDLVKNKKHRQLSGLPTIKSMTV
jgi:hypothetical protein